MAYWQVAEFGQTGFPFTAMGRLRGLLKLAGLAALGEQLAPARTTALEEPPTLILAGQHWLTVRTSGRSRSLVGGPKSRGLVWRRPVWLAAGNQVLLLLLLLLARDSQSIHRWPSASRSGGIHWRAVGVRSRFGAHNRAERVRPE